MLLLREQGLATDKGSFLQIDKVPQAGFQRSPRFREVCTIERIASLQPQSVSGTESAGLDPEWPSELKESLPDRRGCRRRTENLETVLARVPGPGNEQIGSGNFEPVQVIARRQPADLLE